jgi:predicted HicB family RNase H-like nuclease
MITLKQFLEAGNYRITEGSDFGWQCYGQDAYMLDVQVGAHDTNSSGIIFDRVTDEIYQATCYDYDNGRAYRLYGSAEIQQNSVAEAEKRSVSNNQAWDEVSYTDLEVDEDFLEKMTAIMSNTQYSTDISVPVDLDQETLHQLMLMAHAADMTLNKFVEKILQVELLKTV